MEDKQTDRRERVLISAMLEPSKPDPLSILYRVKTALESVEGVTGVDVLQVGQVPVSARTFEQDIEQIINARCLENESMTPDFILASYLKDCLATWNKATRERDQWWSHKPSIGGSSDMSDKIAAGITRQSRP